MVYIVHRLNNILRQSCRNSFSEAEAEADSHAARISRLVLYRYKYRDISIYFMGKALHKWGEQQGFTPLLSMFDVISFLRLCGFWHSIPCLLSLIAKLTRV